MSNENTISPRWYCVSADGLATLCRDEEDARHHAAYCDTAWPRGGPHRAVVLGDVMAERERYASLLQAVEWLLDAGHMNQEHLARLRAAFNQT